MKTKLTAFLRRCLQTPIYQISTVSGGDIASVFKATTDQKTYLVKYQSSPTALSMLQAEERGLETIAKTKTIATPQLYGTHLFGEGALLLMDFIPSKGATPKDYEKLGKQLAQLHQCTAKNFGSTSDNYIGSLPQSNRQQEDWTTFYVEERLLPQLQLALTNNYLHAKEIPSKEAMMTYCAPLLQNVQPSLIHGDLWSGNYLIATDGTPYLIDPAVYYGHGEVDIAMSQLFGGFGPAFYEAYFATHPVKDKEAFQKRNDLYQLYYLLVHLNLFGRSYYRSVKDILQVFTK